MFYELAGEVLRGAEKDENKAKEIFTKYKDKS